MSAAKRGNGASYYGSYSVLLFVNRDSDFMEVWKSSRVRGMYINIITQALMQVHTANNPVLCRIGLASNHTNVVTIKVLCHIRKVALS